MQHYLAGGVIIHLYMWYGHNIFYVSKLAELVKSPRTVCASICTLFCEVLLNLMISMRLLTGKAKNSRKALVITVFNFQMESHLITSTRYLIWLDFVRRLWPKRYISVYIATEGKTALKATNREQLLTEICISRVTYHRTLNVTFEEIN